MSSFDYTDNFSGFNDLINRAEILEEKNWKQLVKGADLTGKLKTYRTDEGDKIGASSRVKNLITIGALERMNIIDEELAKALRRKATSSTHITDILKGVPKLYDELFEGDNPRSLEVVQYIEDNTKELIPYAVKNFTRSEYGAKTEEELKSIDFIDVADDAKEELSDAVGQLDAAESELADSLQMSKEDPTTFIEIKIRDAERVEDVGNIVSKYANEDGLDISGDTVQFSVDPDTPLANAVTAHGIDKIEAALKRDVDRISDSVVVVMAPDEDYERMDDEEMGYGLDEPGGVPGSYAMGEEGGGITEVEDAEDLSAKKARAGKDIGKPGKNFEKISDKAAKKYGSKKAGDRVAGAILAKMRGNYEGEEDGITQKPYISMYKDDEGRTVYDVLDKHGKSAYKSYYKKVAEHWLREYYDIMMREDEEDNELDHFLTKEQPEDYIPSTDYEDVLDALVDDDKKKHAMKKLGSEDEEEAIKMQPMLESHKTNTSVYLTEQAASDKRNKKTETKNQSFKEKYKPKTSWQLEELRRYGL